ncbi:hypothetical protein [Flavobacterium sp.]|uniref:hypothetical protein n=1 Tax=Flavobacterium sp. TaxID=239 RepID=UPI0037529467
MKKSISFLLLIFVLNSCNQNESKNSVDVNKLNEYFYKPKINTVYNKEYNVLFNSNSLDNNELEYLKIDKLSKIINVEFKRLRGFTTYYSKLNPINTGEIIESAILAFSVYEFNNNEDIVHKFFLKENNKYTLKFSLLENVMDTNNQVFLSSLYIPDSFLKSTIGINNFFDKEEVFSKNKKIKEMNLIYLK